MIALFKKIVSKKPKTNPKLMRQLSALPYSDLPLYPINSAPDAAPPTPEPTPDEAAIVASLELEKTPEPPPELQPEPETPPQGETESETPDLTASPLSEAALLKLAELHERNPQD